MVYISVIKRHKRPQEGPKSGGGSGPGATLRHTYDLIDSKTLKGTKNDIMYVDNVCFTLSFLNNHHIAVYFNISTVWGLIWDRFVGTVGVRLDILAVLEPSWGDSWPSRHIF